jgi:hypothetical protein
MPAAMTNRFDNPLPGVPVIESPFFDDLVGELELDEATLATARELRTQGWAVIDFPEPEFDAVAERIKQSLYPRYDWEYWRSTGWQNNDGLRLQDAFRFNKDVRRIAVNPKIIALLSTLYGRGAWPFQTLNFPVGTQQHFHTDSVHFSSVPERFMCGVWVALEDIGPEQGPLYYYSGSHRWPIYTNEHIGLCRTGQDGPASQLPFHLLWTELVRVNKAEPSSFRARKGQALIWTANLLHGGLPQADSALTRWSQVTHYYFDGCSYYTPIESDPFFGRIRFRRPRDIGTGAAVTNMYVGHQVPDRFIHYTAGPLYQRVLSRLRRATKFNKEG